MGEELAETHGAQSGSHGQAADSGTNQGTEKSHIDFSQTPDGRAFMSSVQSAADQRTAAEKRRADAAEAEAADLRRNVEQLSAQVDAIVGTLQNSDPDAAKLLVTEAAQKASQTELKQLREQLAESKQREEQARQAQQALQDHYNWWNTQATNMGLNPYDPAYQAAIKQAWDTNNGSIAMQALMALASKPKEEARQTMEPGFVSPPSGGTARSKPDQDQEAINKTRQAYQSEIDEAIRTHDETSKAHIRQKYRKIFRDKHGLPDIPG